MQARRRAPPPPPCYAHEATKWPQQRTADKSQRVGGGIFARLSSPWGMRARRPPRPTTRCICFRDFFRVRAPSSAKTMPIESARRADRWIASECATPPTATEASATCRNTFDVERVGRAYTLGRIRSQEESSSTRHNATINARIDHPTTRPAESRARPLSAFPRAPSAVTQPFSTIEIRPARARVNIAILLNRGPPATTLAICAIWGIRQRLSLAFTSVSSTDPPPA